MIKTAVVYKVLMIYRPYKIFQKIVKLQRLKKNWMILQTKSIIQKYSLDMISLKLKDRKNYQLLDNKKLIKKLPCIKLHYLQDQKIINGYKIIENNNFKDIQIQQNHGYIIAKTIEK